LRCAGALLDPWNERYLCSEDADYWAKTVMYGLESSWWHGGDLKVRPVP
jgi:ribosome biogenesis protein Tsr3